MRGRCGALIAAAFAATACPAAAASSGPRALIAILPAGRPLAVMASHPELSLGVMSPTLGGYERVQVYLDLSQGSRISTRAYPRKLAVLRVDSRPSAVGGARVAGWPAVERRARGAPGDVLPGLLASTILRRGGSVAYAGISGLDNLEAIAAADESGRIERMSLGPPGTLAARALLLWRSASLLVARLPAGGRGEAALSALLRARRPGDLVEVFEAPPPAGLRLLAVGVAGPRAVGGAVWSGTTRRAGLVAAPDLSATVLDTLGITIPKKMQGERIESRAGHGAGYVRDLKSRLDALLSHRDDAVKVIAIAWAAAALLLWLVRRRTGLRLAGRLFLLAAAWLPAVALLTAAIQPSSIVEALVLAFGSLALGALTDALLPWPAGPLLPAAVSFGAHAIDLAFGSRLIGLSIAGPNPKGGSRFFGIGNELEIILAIAVLVGTGAALTLLPRRAAPRAFAGSCVVAALIVGVGRLGADVGGVVTFGAGGAAAAVASLPGGPTRRAVALGVIAPLVGLAALVGLDLAIGGGAHLTHTLAQSSGPGDLGKVALRRWRLSVAGLTKGTLPIAVAIALVILAAGVRWWRRLLAPLEGEALRPFRAAVIGSFFAIVFCTLANDSGPMIVLIGTVCMLLLVGYVRGRNPPDAPGGARLTCEGARSPGFPLFVHISGGRRKAR